MINTISKMLNATRQSYYNWKGVKPVVQFLEDYFTKEELEEYLSTNKIQKLELIKDYSTYELSRILDENKKNKEKVNKTILKMKLRQFNRISLLYLLYIFKKHQEIKNSTDLISFVDKNTKTPDTTWGKILKFASNFNITIIDSDNVSGQMHIKDFSLYYKEILNDLERDYLLKHKNEFYDTILLMANQKR